jgi:hypothetical protein
MHRLMAVLILMHNCGKYALDKRDGQLKHEKWNSLPTLLATSKYVTDTILIYEEL